MSLWVLGRRGSVVGLLTEGSCLIHLLAATRMGSSQRSSFLDFRSLDTSCFSASSGDLDVPRVCVLRSAQSSLRCELAGEKRLESGSVKSVSVSSGIENGMCTSSRDTPRRTAATRASSLSDAVDVDDVTLLARDRVFFGCFALGFASTHRTDLTLSECERTCGESEGDLAGRVGDRTRGGVWGGTTTNGGTVSTDSSSDALCFSAGFWGGRGA